ncbi:MAG: hypothetical protein IT220_02635 [Flavobacteriaceae bacterium]|nr:hypothetical protein [Flavobacteriaceae bacterium]
MNNKTFILWILIFGMFSSCEYFQLKDANHDSDEVARVGDKVLLKSDLKGLIQPSMSKNDSLKITQNFIESWARREIILQKAKFNLAKEQEDELEKMIEQYKEDLYINSYKANLVSQNIDTIIKDEDIRAFYTANNQIFKLNEDLLRYKMISFQTNDKKATQMRELLKKNDSLSINALLKGDFVFQSIQMNDSLWIKHTEFVNKYDFAKNIDKEQLLQSNKVLEYKEGKITHYIYVKSVLRRGEIAPLLFIKNDVTKMIIHQKKLKYLQDLENKLIQEAIQNNTYEKY